MSSDDRGALYGDALFETLRVWPDGSVRWLERHMARLERSARALGFRRAQIDEALGELARVGSREPGIWRVSVSRDDSEALFGGSGAIRWRWREARPASRPRLGLMRGWYWPGDPLGGIKSTSYLRYIEALRRATALGHDDALLLSADGRLGEATSASAVVRVGGRALTPPLEGILEGVTREGLLADHGEALELREAVIDEATLAHADEICLLSAGSGARAALSLDGRALDDAWTKRVQAILEVVR